MDDFKQQQIVSSASDGAYPKTLISGQQSQVITPANNSFNSEVPINAKNLNAGKSPAITVVIGVGLITVAFLIGWEESGKGGGVGGSIAAVPFMLVGIPLYLTGMILALSNMKKSKLAKRTLLAGAIALVFMIIGVVIYQKTRPPSDLDLELQRQYQEQGLTR